MSNESALSTQVGGGHYKNLKIQPVEYMHANGLGYIEGAIVKYISRYKNKNGKEDLLKIKHFVDLLIELEYKEKIEAKVPAPFKHPKEILNGCSLEEDVGMLVGYCVSLGWTEKTMPSEHCAALVDYLCKKVERHGIEMEAVIENMADLIFSDPSINWWARVSDLVGKKQMSAKESPSIKQDLGNGFQLFKG